MSDFNHGSSGRYHTIACLVALILLLLSTAFPAVQLNGSALECAGGWGMNFLLRRNALGLQSSVPLSAVLDETIGRQDIIRTEIRKINRKVRTARNNKKRQLKVQLAVQTALLKVELGLEAAARECLTGGVVAPSPEVGGITGLVNPSEYSLLEGGQIFAVDGAFLGIFSFDRGHSYSISNSSGSFGSVSAYTSIFNHGGRYGGESVFSPFNAKNQKPPIIYLLGRPAAYLTSNTSLSGARVDAVNMLSLIPAR